MNNFLDALLTEDMLNNDPQAIYAAMEAGDMPITDRLGDLLSGQSYQDPRTLSGAIQEELGAREPNQAGRIGEILSQRLNPSLEDISKGAVNTLMSGKPVSGQDIADEKLAEAMNRFKALQDQSGSGNTPAAIQIANEIQRRRQIGDIQGAQLLESTSKIYDRGTYFDPTTNSINVMPGYGSAIGNIALNKRIGTREADIATAAEIERQKMLGGPLPNTVVTAQDELIDAMQTHKYLSGQMDKFVGKIDSGELKLDVIGNIINKQRNNISLSTQESRNLASFQATLERLRNESLRLNKGVQTEGDAVRAWNEVVQNINDPMVVRQRLAEIKEYNDIAKELKFERLKLMRGEFGRETPSNILPTVGPQGQGANPAITQPYDQIRPAMQDVDIDSLINEYAD